MKRPEPKKKVIEIEDYTFEIYHGKYGAYRYRSPRYGFKMAHRYDTLIVILQAGRKVGMTYWNFDRRRRMIPVVCQQAVDFIKNVDPENRVQAYKDGQHYGFYNQTIREALDRAKLKGWTPYESVGSYFKVENGTLLACPMLHEGGMDESDICEVTEWDQIPADLAKYGPKS